MQYRYPGELERVIDGDTYEFTVDLGFHVFKRITLRLKGIDTHEIGGEKSKKALEEQKFAARWLKSNKFHVSTEEHAPETDSFGRWLGHVINDDGESLGEALKREFDNIDYEG